MEQTEQTGVISTNQYESVRIIRTFLTISGHLSEILALLWTIMSVSNEMIKEMREIFC